MAEVQQMPSASSSSTLLEPRPPSAPRVLAPPAKMAKPEIIPLNSFAVSVQWTPPADLHSRRVRAQRAMARDGGGAMDPSLPVVGYRLRYLARTPTAEEAVAYVVCDEGWPPDVREAVLKWLIGGKEYTFEVAAYNAAGEGPWSDPSEPFLMPTDHWPDPEGRPPPTFLSTRPDSIEIKWDMPCHRGAQILSYDILCSEDPSFSQGKTRQLSIPGDATTLRVDSLKPNTVYYFKYRAVNAKGPSAWSPPTPGAGTAAMPPCRPDPPTRLGPPESWRPFEINVKWRPPESYNIPIQHFRVRRSLYPDMRDAAEVVIGTGPTGAVPITEDGRKIEEPVTTAVSPSGGSQRAATLLSPTASPAARRPGFSRNGYALTQLKVKGLHPGTNYYFQVMAVNQIGESPWSLPSEAMRTTSSPPARCEKPRCLGGNKYDGMRLCWPVPESYGVPVTRYDVRVAMHAMMLGFTETSNVQVQPHTGDLGRIGETLVETVMGNAWDPGVSHFYQVRAVSSAGVGDWSETSEEAFTAPEVPVRPDMPHRFSMLPRAIVVYWRAPDARGSPITGYHLRHDTSRDMLNPVEIRRLNGTETEFAVPGLHPHLSYYFQVRAVNAVGVSEWSVPSRPVAVMQVPPSKMGAPVLISRTSSSLTLGFTPPVESGTLDGELIQYYTLVYCTGPQRLATLKAKVGREDETVGVVRRASPGGTEVAKLRPGALVAFQVYAVNEFGEGEPSEVAEFATDSAAPDAPEAPRMVEFTSWSLTVGFKPGEENGAKTLKYGLAVEDVESRESWELGPWDVTLDADGHQYHGIHNLKPGRAYRIQARTMNARGTSPWSAPSEHCFTEPSPPAPVVTAAVEATTGKSFIISWKAPYAYGDPVVEYIVQWSPDNEFVVNIKEQRVPPSEDPRATCDGATAGSLCYARVAAVNNYGQGDWGNVVQAMLKADIPHPPARPRVVEVGPIHARISWMVPYDSGSRIINFWLRYTETETDGRPPSERDCGEMLVLGRKHVCIVEPLFSRREYIYEIAAENEMGLGPYSPPSLPTRVAPPALPTPVGEPIWISSTLTSLTMKWNASEPMGSEILEQVARIGTSPTFEEGTYRDVSLPPWTSSMPGATKEPMADSVAPSSPRSHPRSPGASPKSPAAGGAAPAGPPPADETPEARDRRLLEEKKRTMRRAKAGTSGLAALLMAGRPQKEAIYTIDGCFQGTGFYVKVCSRNGVGLGAWGPESALMATEFGVPMDVPKDPGIVHLRNGCTTLTFGWQRPFCNGAPVSHYIVRCAETEKDLWKEGCLEFVHEEPYHETWPGIMNPLPPGPDLSHLTELHDEEAISTFVQYVLVRFGTLEESWQWLDINGNGEISREEFLEGDVDNGPPFADFTNKEALETAWKLMDADGKGSISVDEYSMLRPYMERVRSGSAGTNYDGVYFLVPSLTPGKSYHIMVRAVNKAGMSPGWTKCATDPHKTDGLMPARTPQLQGVPELRTTDGVAFRWELPWHNGDPLRNIEVRYAAQDVELGPLSRKALREGTLLKLDNDPKTGALPTRLSLKGFLPGQIVFAVARCFNSMGGSREWSNLPGPGGGIESELITWDCSTLPMPPEALGQPVIEAGTARSAASKSCFDFRVPLVGRTNGLHIAFLEIEVLDVEGHVVRRWESESNAQEMATVRAGDKYFRRSVSGLAPGQEYMVRVRAKNAVGPAPWSSISDAVRMPPDLPKTPRAPLTEFTSLRFIELKWYAPHSNGSPIVEWDVAYAFKENAPDSAYIHAAPHALANVKEHGEDGRRTAPRDRGSLICRVDDLKVHTSHYFKIRCRNGVGWSPWSEVAVFKTKAVEPSKIDKKSFVCELLGAREIKISWHEPENNGLEIQRYDVIAGPCIRMMRWAHLTQGLLRTTVDVDKLYGYALPEAATVGENLGEGEMDKLVCSESVFGPLPGDRRDFLLSNLLPGQDYYFSVRALNLMGKGEFCEILGPIRTLSDRPAGVAQLEVSVVDHESVVLLFTLPYNMGSPIFEAHAVLTRAEGPLSHDELHPETREPHDHIQRREFAIDVNSPPAYFHVELSAPRTGGWVPGTTNAVRRANEEQGEEGQYGQWSGVVPTLASPTGVFREVPVGGLRPGTRYEVTWTCRNDRGWSPLAEYTTFVTEATIPDKPPPMSIPSL